MAAPNTIITTHPESLQDHTWFTHSVYTWGKRMAFARKYFIICSNSEKQRASPSTLV